MNESPRRDENTIRRMERRFINPVLQSPYALILPALAICVCFSVIPALMALRNSFFNVDYVTGVNQFVGLANYRSIFTDRAFVQVFRNTVVFTCFTVLFGIPLAVLTAVFLNANTPLRNFTQGVVFTPHIISSVSVSILWAFMMDPQFGILNYVLGLFGIRPLMWLLSEKTSLLSIIIVSVWKTLGYNVLIVVSALQTIPQDVYESAMLDRSGPVKTFFHITLPMISPFFVFLITTCVAQTLNTFDLVRLMTGGGPKNSSNLMVYWIYETGFLHFQVGKAMAGAVIFMLFVGSLSILNFTLVNRRAYYQ
jgi:sn-glycerol 3-phosphate transport system permease protein